MTIERWEIDSSHSAISFAVRHLGIHKVRGRFSRWSGYIQVPDGDWNRATVDVVIDVSSIETGIAARDRHLRDEDYFDVRRHPEMAFRTRLLTSAVSGRRRLVGDLTIKGRTRAVTLEVQDNGRARDAWGNERVGFLAHTAVNRRDFGVNRNITIDRVVIAETVDVEIELEAVRQQEARAA